MPEPNIFRPETIGHKDIDIFSIINISLWNKAKWRGMMFNMSLDKSHLVLAPVFTDKNAGVAIFKEWISLVGKTDEKDIIRVGIIKGIDAKHPYYYKVLFTGNADSLASTDKFKIITIPSRFHVMEAKDDKNLVGFESVLKRISTDWKYILVPAYIDSKTNQPNLFFDYSIRKKFIEIKSAWEISIDSWLSFAITLDDNPIIPPFVVNAPINEVRNRLKQLEKNKDL